MLLVTQTENLCKRYGMEKAIEMLSEAGFDGLDLTMTDIPKGTSAFCTDEYREYAKKYREIAKKNNIPFVQAHAPCEYRHEASDEDVEKMTKLVIRSIEVASLAGCEIIVVHPLQHMNYTNNIEKLFKMNVEYYSYLAQYAEKFNIKIAAENMFQNDKHTGLPKDSTCALPSEFCSYIDEVGSPYVVGCLDIGHCVLVNREPSDVLMYMGKDRIKCIHLHDNDYRSDLHTLPYTGKIDFEPIFRAFADMGYEGNITYECDKFLTKYDDEMVPMVLKFMHDTGRNIISRIESYKHK